MMPMTGEPHPAQPRIDVLELVAIDPGGALTVLDLNQHEPRVLVLDRNAQNEEERRLRMERVGRSHELRSVV